MLWIWLGFIVFVLLLLALDLGVLHRRAEAVSVRQGLWWSAGWVALGLSFSAFIFFAYDGHWLGLGLTPDPVDGQVNGGGAALQKYLTGYVVEKSLSVDNIFVIAMVFSSFAVPAVYQHRVLLWGILGALVMRGIMIGIGARLIADFHWVLYVFAAFLIGTAVKMLTADTAHGDPNHNIVVRLVRRWMPVTTSYHGEHFIVRAGSAASHEAARPGDAALPDTSVDAAAPGTLMLTPLALALAVVESTDVVFAVDSIPAIFAITGDPFIVFTSNVFAMLGLRSLYFALAGMVAAFRYLKVALAGVLLVVGVKMLLAGWLKAVLGQHFNLYILGVIFATLGAGIVASLWADRQASASTTTPA